MKTYRSLEIHFQQSQLLIIASHLKEALKLAEESANAHSDSDLTDRIDPVRNSIGSGLKAIADWHAELEYLKRGAA